MIIIQWLLQILGILFAILLVVLGIGLIKAKMNEKFELKVIQIVNERTGYGKYETPKEEIKHWSNRLWEDRKVLKKELKRLDEEICKLKNEEKVSQEEDEV